MAVPPSAQNQPQRSNAALAIAQHIQRASEVQFNGCLNFESAHIPRLRLFFVAGRLVWGGGGLHRLRRWRRLLKQICPGAIFALAQLTPAEATPLWEYEALKGLVRGEHISRDQAKQLIDAQVCEVMFDAIQAAAMVAECRCREQPSLKISGAILLLPVQDVLPRVEAQWQTWCDGQLLRYSPNLSPLLDNPQQLQTQVSPQTYSNLTQILRGQHSLRELAALMQQDLAKFSQVLIAYEQQQLIQMRITTDTAGSIPIPGEPLPDPTLMEDDSPQQRQPLPAEPRSPLASAPKAPLILCIDDNAKVCDRLGQTLTRAGYRYHSLQDALQGVPQAIELKPDLIFVDLVMPMLGGYELCAQLRRIAILQKVPIIILTGNDRMLDPRRGKLAGVNEYLTKPAKPEQVLALVQRWLTPQAC